MRINASIISILLLLNSLLGFTMAYAKNTATHSKNRLANEDSPYLRLHADNPVNWYPWGKEAFDKAKKENKLIFLSIGYSTCYWCHVMEQESFSDLKVADLMNHYYVNIKVDREQRPDVDDVYLTALQLMNNEGGWPVSIFLTPDLKPFFGVTYISKAEFVELLNSIHASWEGEYKKGIQKRADQVAAALKRATHPEQMSQEKALSSPEVMKDVVSHYQKLFDATYGGFQSQPKFPQFPILELLIADYRYRNNPDSLSMLTQTLDAILQGGIHDQVGGGLHRYTVDRQWGIPHFEKILDGQAQALMVYAQAYQITQNESYQYMVRRIVAYLKDKLLSPEGLFYAAEDAQTNQKEGQTYIWSKEALQQALSAQEFDFVGKVYDLKEKSWGEDKHKNQGIILNFTANPKKLAKEQNVSLKTFYQKLSVVNKQLLKHRKLQVQPNLDTKIITSWNGLTISALAYVSQVFNDKDYRQLAERAAQALWQNLHNETIPLYHMMWRNNAQIPAYLDDYASTVLAFSRLYEATHDKAWLSKAKILADAMIKRLWSPYDNFYYVEPNTKDLISHQQLTFDGATPAGNSLAVKALIKLSAVSGDKVYVQYAEKVLKTYSATLENNPLVLPYMASTLYDYEMSKAKSLYSASYVKMVVKISERNLSSNQPITVNLNLRITKGWHINANPASLDFLIPTTVKISMDKGDVRFRFNYPKGEEILFANKQTINVYKDNISLPIELILEKTNKDNDNKATLTITTRVQACNDEGRCLLPSDLAQTIPVLLREE